MNRVRSTELQVEAEAEAVAESVTARPVVMAVESGTTDHLVVRTSQVTCTIGMMLLSELHDRTRSEATTKAMLTTQAFEVKDEAEAEDVVTSGMLTVVRRRGARVKLDRPLPPVSHSKTLKALTGGTEEVRSIPEYSLFIVLLLLLEPTSIPY